MWLGINIPCFSNREQGFMLFTSTPLRELNMGSRKLFPSPLLLTCMSLAYLSASGGSLIIHLSASG